jgi:hypothetical protein
MLSDERILQLIGHRLPQMLPIPRIHPATPYIFCHPAKV